MSTYPIIQYRKLLRRACLCASPSGLSVGEQQISVKKQVYIQARIKLLNVGELRPRKDFCYF
jgi:hypothetical protein